MSVLFGRWDFEGRLPDPSYIAKVNETLAPYGPDSDEAYSKGGVTILYRAFHTTEESRNETQPHTSSSGVIITWDGRLDNRAELIDEVKGIPIIDCTDIAIVTAAYEKWGTGCFAKLIGDWAISIWNPIQRLLILAKDPIGTRHLYYSIEKDQVTWSTVLDPLVLFARKTFAICEEYIAGWLSYFPAAHLTPYVGIHAVPPSSSVLLRPGRHIITKYWDFDPGKRIGYRTDAEYEEHFRIVFAQAVQRRLRSDKPVLAELSGGMDSSSIVCMADNIIARGHAGCPCLDTISWYDDTYDHIERDSNELHWITKVEEKRGRTGCRINLASLTEKMVPLRSQCETDRFVATPVAGGHPVEFCTQYATYMRANKHRVTLSGIGGDEVTCGDVPKPTLELQNLMARAHFLTLAHQLQAWALKMKKPRLPLLWRAARGFLSHTLTDVSIDLDPASWFQSGFVRRNYAALYGYPFRIKLFGPLPSFQENVAMLNVLRRLIANWTLDPELLREVRFPYLDRAFLEYLYAIPREQIVGVGKRRFLMKRALVGIVPDELLNRRRKAFVPQRPKKNSSTIWPSSQELGWEIIASSAGIIDPNRFLEVLQKAGRNEEVTFNSLRDALALESWLRRLTTRGILANSMSTKRQDSPSRLEAKECQVPSQPKSSAS